MWWLLLACTVSSSPADSTGSGTPTGDGGGATSSTSDGGTDTGDPCEGVPLVNYATFGQGFLTANCQGCHASTSPERYGAPEWVVFDTVQDAWTWKDRILELVPGKAGARMPPAGGITEDDQQRLRWWLLCAEPGT